MLHDFYSLDDVLFQFLVIIIQNFQFNLIKERVCQFSEVNHCHYFEVTHWLELEKGNCIWDTKGPYQNTTDKTIRSHPGSALPQKGIVQHAMAMFLYILFHLNGRKVC